MTDYERGVEQASAIYKEVIREYVAENAKLRELVCHLWYVKPRDVTSVLVEGRLVDLEELMEGVGLRWEDES